MEREGSGALHAGSTALQALNQEVAVWLQPVSLGEGVRQAEGRPHDGSYWLPPAI